MKTAIKKKSRSKIKKDLDKVFSEFIRARDNYTCIVCGKRGAPKDGVMQNGHLFTSAAMSTRYSEVNCNCQCSGCNMSHEYDFEPYRRAFVEKHGQIVYDNLYLLHKSTMKYTNSELLVMTEYYKQKLKQFNSGVAG